MGISFASDQLAPSLVMRVSSCSFLPGWGHGLGQDKLPHSHHREMVTGCAEGSLRACSHAHSHCRVHSEETKWQCPSAQRQMPQGNRRVFSWGEGWVGARPGGCLCLNDYSGAQTGEAVCLTARPGSLSLLQEATATARGGSRSFFRFLCIISLCIKAF